DVDLDPALGELLGCVAAEPARDLREDVRGGVDEHPALRPAAELRVVPDRVGYEIGELREGLDPRVAGPDEDEGQLPGRAVGIHRRSFEAAQDVVAEVDRVREVLEAEAMLCQSGDREHAGNGTEREHEPLVLDVEAADGSGGRRLVIVEPGQAGEGGPRASWPEEAVELALSRLEGAGT